jgi:hypothetical protein
MKRNTILKEGKIVKYLNINNFKKENIINNTNYKCKPN